MRRVIKSLLISIFLMFFSFSIYAQNSASIDPSLDILDQLNAIDGLSAEEAPNAPPGYRFFVMSYRQPVIHEKPGGAFFFQRMTLLHKETSAPMVLRTNGYYISVTSTYRTELTRLFSANQLSVEHRYFKPSIPTPVEWSHLTIEESANDHHRIISAIRPLYEGKWVTTGASKGGMTAMYHRRFFPEDVDATVSYVAPLSFGRKDMRYVDFLENVGTAECRDKLKAIQRETLKRRTSMAALIKEWTEKVNLPSTLLKGGFDQALDIAVSESYYSFWQYQPIKNCAAIPEVTATDKELFSFLTEAFPMYYITDVGLKRFEPYFYQAVTQLGYPMLNTEHLKDLLLYDANDYQAYILGPYPESFDYEAMLDIKEWTLDEAERVIFVNGENDPWYAGAFPVPSDDDDDDESVYSFLVLQGTHGANISKLPEHEKTKAISLLSDWLKATPSELPLTREEEPLEIPYRM